MAARVLVSAMTEVRVVIEKSLFIVMLKLEWRRAVKAYVSSGCIIYAYFLSDIATIIEIAKKLLFLFIHVIYIFKKSINVCIAKIYRKTLKL